jgi:predicted RNA-binding Zn-ribbon protein involved in translation (DUF1610 family)
MRLGTAVGLLLFFVFLGVFSYIFGGGCNDGWQSSSIGQQGACSHHGGVNRGGIKVPLISFILACIAGWYLNKKENPKAQNDIRNDAPKVNYVLDELTDNNPYVDIVTSDVEQVSQLALTSTDYAKLTCPKCGAGMIRRTARRGSNCGNEFFGCSRYPRCRGALSLNIANRLLALNRLKYAKNDSKI